MASVQNLRKTVIKYVTLKSVWQTLARLDAGLFAVSSPPDCMEQSTRPRWNPNVTEAVFRRLLKHVTARY